MLSHSMASGKVKSLKMADEVADQLALAFAGSH